MEKVLKLKRVLPPQNGVTADEVIAEIATFTYSSQRMAGAPTISATLMSVEQVDINSNCYTDFNGERYYVKQTPTRTRANTDARYKYDINFVSERDVLDNIYFYDATMASSAVDSRLTHNTKFVWSGTVLDYIDKLNESLKYSLGEDTYYISREGLATDSELECKFLTLENQFFTTALQEIYNTFELPYYFEGKTIKIGYQSSSINEDYELDYGIDKGLLSVTKNNANYKVINKCTAIGSSENLPYYYPNKSADGEHEVTWDEGAFGDVFVNFDVLSKQIRLGGGETLTFHYKQDAPVSGEHELKYYKYAQVKGQTSQLVEKQGAFSFTDTVRMYKNGTTRVTIKFSVEEEKEYSFYLDYAFQVIGSDVTTEVLNQAIDNVQVIIGSNDNSNYVDVDSVIEDNEISFIAPKEDSYHRVEYAIVTITFRVSINVSKSKDYPLNMSFAHWFNPKLRQDDYFYCERNGKEINYLSSGISLERLYEGGVVEIGPSINLMPYQPNLVPSIYRGTLGAERFYKAMNETYSENVVDDLGNSLEYVVDYFVDGGDGTEERAVFSNPYNPNNRNYKEHTFSVDDLKPTIKEVEYKGKRVDLIEDVAFDKNDNNELDDNNEYKHSYFYVKLRPLGFNLFDHASENGDMTVSMTSGDCTACNFTIGVNENKKNDFQVDSYGNLKFGDDGKALRGTPQKQQNNTTNNYVWIALKKEEQTYGMIMPNYEKNMVVKSGDSFVLLNINLPFIYIDAAE